jgi:hypothetical protein
VDIFVQSGFSVEFKSSVPAYRLLKLPVPGRAVNRVVNGGKAGHASISL